MVFSVVDQYTVEDIRRTRFVWKDMLCLFVGWFSCVYNWIIYTLLQYLTQFISAKIDKTHNNSVITYITTLISCWWEKL